MVQIHPGGQVIRKFRRFEDRITIDEIISGITGKPYSGHLIFTLVAFLGL